MFSIPMLGLGTWDLRGEECALAVREALQIGYRHIDTAQMYENEREVGRGLSQSGIARPDVFVTTKLWLDNLGPDNVAPSFDASLERLSMDYVDLLLIHWPSREVPLEHTLTAMERIRESGKTRAIGVSNFPSSMWERALELASVEVNQVEFHPFLEQRALLELAKKRKLRLVAYCPIAKGRVSRDPEISEIAKRHGRTPAQISLRWLLQQDVAVIPKARGDHLAQNAGIFDFELSEVEMERVSARGAGQRLVNPGWAPQWD